MIVDFGSHFLLFLFYCMVFIVTKIKYDKLTVYYQNVRGLRTKTHTFYKNLTMSNYDIIILSETWLNNSVMSSELFENRYKVYRRDRETSGFHNKKEGGGALIAVSTKLNSTRITTWESNCEDLWVAVDVCLSGIVQRLVFCALNLPSPVSLPMLKHFIDNCNSIMEKQCIRTCIVGDFNLGSIDWAEFDSMGSCSHTSTSTQILIDFCNIHNLKQVNNIINKSGKILDLVLVDSLVCRLSKSLDPLSVVDGFHPPLEFQLDCDVATLKANPNNVRLNFRKGNYEAINSELTNIQWSDTFSNTDCVDEMVEIFYDKINCTIKKYVPEHKQRTQNYPQWYSRELISRLREKNKYRTRYKKYKNPLDEISFRLLSKRCQKLISDCYRTFLKRTEEMITDNPNIFLVICQSQKGRQWCISNFRKQRIRYKL